MKESVSRIPILFKIEGLGNAKGEFIRFLAPRTVDALVRKLPIEGRAALLENKVFFEVPIIMGEEKAKSIADTGMLAYWPMGKALCIFLNKIKPYSAINPVGRISENISIFTQIKSGTKITVVRN